MDQRCLHARDPGRVVASVDGVEVTGDAREGGHVGGGGHGDPAQQTASGGGRGASGAPRQLGGRGHGGARGAPADGEAFAHEGDQIPVRPLGGVGQLEAHVDDATGAGLLQGSNPPVDLDDGPEAGLGAQLGQRAVQVDGVVKMDGSQQALDERHTVFDDASQGRVDHRPARAEQGVGDQRSG